MKKYGVVVDGKAYRVEVGQLRTGRPASFKVNGTSRRVELPGEFKHGQPFTIRVDDRSYEVEVGGIEEGAPFPVKVDRVVLRVELSPRPAGKPSQLLEPYQPRYGRKAAEEVEEGTIAAPMTGKVLAVKVKEGEAVKTGSVVCILEAMKMENEIKSPRGGQVRRVKVAEGMTVNKGDPLVIVS